MKPTVEQLENLLALRRDERPEEGYSQDFLCEFHHRQRERAEALCRIQFGMNELLPDGRPSWLLGGHHGNPMLREEPFLARYHDGCAIDQGNVANPDGAVFRRVNVAWRGGNHDTLLAHAVPVLTNGTFGASGNALRKDEQHS